MGNRRWLAIGAVLAAGVLSAPVHAQAPATGAASDINPPVADCNVTPDTIPDPNNPGKRTAQPVTAALLKLGQPCEEKVSIKGLTDDKLDNLQRGFDFFSWLTFVALNSPVDGKVIGQGPRAGGDAMTKWEALANYRPLADVMLGDARKPEWGQRIVPDACKTFDGPGKIILQLSEESWNQPFKTGPLIDQSGNYALFDILMNKPMFSFIVENGLYSQEGQQQLGDKIEFPIGVNPGAQPGRMGAVMIKVSWRIIDPGNDKDLLSKYHTADALIYFPGPPHTKAGPACVEKTLGLIGFHVGHKTKGAPQWVWSSFEHISNVPTQKQVDNGDLHPPYSFYNPACKQCAHNTTPPGEWDPPVFLKVSSDYRSQIVRKEVFPSSVAKEVKDLNDSFHAILKDTVWQNYILVTTQWPSDSQNPIDPTGVPAPTFMANTTLETYSQGEVPLASSSCMACHGNATTHHVPAVASDFTYILEKAQKAH
jgi:hypothetical protein